MSNKRILKKRVRQACGDLAAEILIARHTVPGIDKAAVTKIISDIASLQCDTLANCSFSFDRTPADFETRQAYRKARAEYNHKAYEKIRNDFRDRVVEIVKEMNAALPKKG